MRGLLSSPTAISILVLAAVILIEVERLNHTLDELDNHVYQHWNSFHLPGER
jgi:hypothetical protein